MNNKRAFTLVELLVVIAIIALLMSILMPVISKARRQAQEVVCLSNLKQWAPIFSMYTMDNNGYFSDTSYRVTSVWWIAPLRPYYSAQEDILLCPSAAKKNPNSLEGGPRNAWTVPPEYSELPQGDCGSYGINGWVCNLQERYIWAGRGMIEYHWKTINVKGGDKIPLFLDCGTIDGWPWQFDLPPSYNGDIESPPPLNEMRRFCLDRHDRYINSLFLDLSVRKVGLKELWKLKWHRKFDTNGPTPVWSPWMKKYKDFD